MKTGEFVALRKTQLDYWVWAKKRLRHGENTCKILPWNEQPLQCHYRQGQVGVGAWKQWSLGEGITAASPRVERLGVLGARASWLCGCSTRKATVCVRVSYFSSNNSDRCKLPFIAAQSHAPTPPPVKVFLKALRLVKVFVCIAYLPKSSVAICICLNGARRLPDLTHRFACYVLPAPFLRQILNVGGSPWDPYSLLH